MDKEIERIVNKGWDNLNKKDLEYFFIENDFIKQEVADLFNVTKSQVSYKLRKYDISIQKKMLGNALEYAIKQTKKATIQELIFASDMLIEDYEPSELVYGPVKVTKGQFKGRIGCFYDDENSYGFVYWGNMVSSLDACSRIKLSYLSNDITTFDLVKRQQELSNQISFMRAKQQETGALIENYEIITELYGEYVYIMGLLNKVYEDTFYLENSSNKKVFLSYSSKDKDIAMLLATDLKRAKYKMWFDVWDIEGGHSIPEEISKGLESSDVLVMLVSKNYSDSAFCRDEWQSFYMKYNKEKPNSIIPIIIDDSEMPALLASRRYLKITEEHGYNEVLNELKRALKKL